MPLTDRMNIQKGKNLIIFVNFCTRYLSGNDLTEDAIVIAHPATTSFRTKKANGLI
jgi:hypothetical protein